MSERIQRAGAEVVREPGCMIERCLGEESCGCSSCQWVRPLLPGIMIAWVGGADD